MEPMNDLHKKVSCLSIVLLGILWTSAISQNSWTQKTDFGGTARRYAVGFSIGSMGYIGTGYDGVRKKDFWEYNPSSETWTQKADFGGSARDGAIGFSIGTKGYLGTGYDGVRKKDFWEFDPLSNTWTLKADFGGTARQLASGFSIGTKGYIGTGDDGTYKKDFWEYDPASNTWTLKADFGGVGRHAAVGFSIGTKGYIGTGYSSGVRKKDYWEFDPLSNTWSQKADFGGTARQQASGFSVGTKGYIGTGNDGSYKKDFWQYDPVSDTWTQKAEFSGTSRSFTVGFSIGTRGYIGTGLDGSNKRDFWEYTPDGFITGWIAGNPFCAGNTMNVPFTVSTIRNTGNIFTAQLSDETGSFAYPVSIGTLSGTGSGTISATIPSGASLGNSYKIRVISSDPPENALDNQINLSIFPSVPTIPGTITGLQNICSPFNNVSYSITLLPDATSYLWLFPSGVTTNQSFSNSIVANYTSSAISGDITVKGHNGCGDGPASTLTVNVANCGNNQWEQEGNFGGIGRSYAVGFSIGRKGYLGTGFDDAVYKKDFWEYDPVSDVWSQKADFGGTARIYAVGFSIGSKGYIGTGNDGTNKKDFWEYNPLSNTWTNKSDFGGTARKGAVGFSIGNKGYIGTGYDVTSKKDFWEYDPESNSWTMKTNFGGSARYYAVGFSILTNGYIGTGFNGSELNDFWEYDPMLNSWIQKTSFGGTARYSSVGFGIGPKGYLGTGYGGSRKKDFWEYNPVANNWTQKPEFTGTARSGAVGFSIGSSGYIGTGDDPYKKNDFYQYIPEGFVTGLINNDPFCISNTVNVPFTIGSFRNPGNIYTAQLSNASGSFVSPTPIGTLTGTYSGTIFALIPTGTPSGTGYRIRVVSSDPVDIAIDNQVNLSIHSNVPAMPGSITGIQNICKPMNNLIYSVTSVNDAVTYSWSFPLGVTTNQSISNTCLVNYTNSAISGIITVNGHNGCGDGPVSTLPVSTVNCGSNSWIQKVDFSGTAREYSVGFSIGIKGYIGLGIDPNLMNDFWEFDPVLNSWTQKANISGTVRYHATGFSIGSKGYIGTGVNNSGNTKEFWEFNPLQNSWTQKADFGGTARCEAVGFSIGSKGYIGTGKVVYNSYLKDFWEYDPVSNTWTQKADFGGTARYSAVGFSIGSKGYIGTGNDGSRKKDFWEYEPSSNTWTQKTEFGGNTRDAAVGFSIGTKGYIGTGYTTTYANTQDFWEFDPNLNTWQRKADFSGTGRCESVGFSIGTKGYVGTGFGGPYNKDFWEYTPQGFITGLVENNSFCAGNTLNVSFTLENTRNPGNIFTAQLSDETGSFSSPVSIGTLAGTTNGIILSTIPSVTPEGDDYRIRVISSDPVEISTDNQINLTIYSAVPGIPGSITGSQNICKPFNSIQYFIDPVINATSYIWSFPFGVTNNQSLSELIIANFTDSSISGNIYVKGHNICGDGSASTVSVNVANCGNNRWVRMSNFGGTARYGAVGLSIGNRGYLGTGIDDTQKKDFWEFNPGLNEWTRKDDLGEYGRSFGAGFSIKTSGGLKGYIGTGYNIYNTDDFWEFDPLSNTWTQKTNIGGTRRGYATGFSSILSKGYIGTGHDGNHKKDFWEFDPELNIWTQKSDFGGTARSSSVGFSIGMSGYIGTGIDGTLKDDFWEYNFYSNTWTQKANFGGGARFGAVGFSIKAKGYIGTGAGNNGICKDFWEYDPVSNNWSRKTDFVGEARYYATGFSLGSKGYIGTGEYTSQSKFNDFWQYTPDGFRTGIVADNPICAGQTIQVPFTISTPRNPGNIFTAQLSDALGSFSSPTTIGSFAGVFPDTIFALIPDETPYGIFYRIRVISSDPSEISSDNYTDLTITTGGTVTGGSTIDFGQTTNTLTFTGQTSPVLKWQKCYNGGTFIDIPATTGLTAYYETPIYPGMWNYRSVIQNSNCGSQNSVPTSVIVNLPSGYSKVWTGVMNDDWNISDNWYPSGVPGSTDNIMILESGQNMPVIKNSGTVSNEILIQDGSTLTVNQGNTTTANKDVMLKGLSSGSLNGNGGTCSACQVNGPFISGVALNSSNKVTIQVNVTETGGYLLSTNTVNGYSFSKSGNFTTTGLQYLVLDGTGNPVINGTDVFTVNYQSSSCTFIVNVCDAPSQPSSISGPLTPCRYSTGLIYSISTVNYATYYTWTLPAGWSILSGQGTISISVTAGTLPGNITVTPSNYCGYGPSRTMYVSTVSIPFEPSVVSGPASPCQNTPGLNYSVTNVNGVTFNWSVPSGWSITAGQGTNGISVTSGITGSIIQVTPSNTCGSGISRIKYISTTSVPAQPSVISGQSSPCQNTQGLSYSVTNVSGITYTWIVPSDWSITAGQGLNSISVTSGTVSGDVTVTPSNSCGDGTNQTLAVTSVPAVPLQPSAIAGPASPCQNTAGLSYSVINMSGVTYTWTVPSGWSITAGQGSSSITVTSGTASGDVTVTPSNSCGVGTVQTIAVTITPAVPSQPSAITGPDSPCQNNTGISYHVINVSGVTYTWTVPSGWSIIAGQGSNSITVTSGTASGDVTVTPSNFCGVGTVQTITVTITPAVPSQSSAITGPASSCQNTTGITYHVINVSGVTYTWTVPSGWSITAGQGSNSITVTSGTVSGDVTVTPSNACGDGTFQIFAVTTTPAVPSQPSAITGPDSPCQNTTGISYHVINVSGVTYTWTVPSGWSITAGQGSNSITVTSGTVSGDVTVTPSNACGDGPLQIFAVTTTPAIPSQPSFITGQTSPCQNVTDLLYIVTNVSGVTYTWTVPSGWTITAGQGTNIITVTSGTSSGNIEVMPTNSCGDGTSQLLAVSTITVPAQPSPVNGLLSPCQLTSGISYSVTNIAGVSYYAWTIPPGWSLTDGQGTDSLTVTSGTISGNITVTPSNTCGNGEVQILAVTITQAVPSQPSAITGPAAPCQNTAGLVYIIDNVSGITYTWTVPSGWSTTAGQGSNSITATSGTTSGDVTVTPSNSCGNGTAQTLPVTTTSSVPSQPSTISGSSSPCQNTTGLIYSVTNVTGVIYTWAVPSGWSITAGQGTNSITVTSGTSTGNIVVTPSNSCGNGPTQQKSVSTTPCGSGTCSFTFTFNTVTTAGYTWLDRNLGASRVAQSFNDYQAYGSLYQWARYPDGHECINWTSSTSGSAVNGTTSTQCTNTTPANPCGHNLFVLNASNWTTQGSSQHSWWNGLSKGTADPCPSGYRVPSQSELQALKNSFSPANATGAYNSQVKMTVAGNRSPGSGNVVTSGSIGNYWSSTFETGQQAYYLTFNSSYSSVYAVPRVTGYSVRCIQE